MTISPRTSFSVRAGNLFSVVFSGEDALPTFFVDIHFSCPEFFYPEIFCFEQEYLSFYQGVYT